MDIIRDATVHNWDGTWTYRPRVLVTPRTPEDIVVIMRDPVRFPSPVRPDGAMHSTARMNGDGVPIEMQLICTLRARFKRRMRSRI